MFWLLEKDCYDSVDNELLIQALKDTGTSYEEVEKYELISNDNHEMYPEKTFFYGSINTCCYLFKKSNMFVPDFTKYNCLSYYSKLAENEVNHLNDDGFFVSLSMFLNNFNYYERILCDYNKSFFVRPVSGLKTFTGRVVNFFSSENFIDFQDEMKMLGVTPDSLVVIAYKKSIHNEYRLAVVDGKIVGASLYKDYLGAKMKEGCPEKILKHAEEIIGRFSIDDYYVMDMAELSNGDVYLIEYNALNSSGLYAMNRKPVVEAINAYCEKHNNDD